MFKGGVIAIGKIERVLRGDISLKTITIFAPYDECFVGFSTGTHGIVIGHLERDKRGGFELLARSERAWKSRFPKGSP
jgi:hypothetical protein